MDVAMVATELLATASCQIAVAGAYCPTNTNQISTCEHTCGRTGTITKYYELINDTSKDQAQAF